MICFVCGRDINAIGQDNMSSLAGYPICEDCCGDDSFDMTAEIEHERACRRDFERDSYEQE